MSNYPRPSDPSDMSDFNPQPGSPEWDASLEEINRNADEDARDYEEEHRFDD